MSSNHNGEAASVIHEVLAEMRNRKINNGRNHSAALEAWASRIEAALSTPALARAPPALTVWEGTMPESNGKTNFAAVLIRRDAKGLEGLTEGFTIDISEHPDRVRYEADRVRHLIGELDEAPDILAYDPDKHSGYVRPTKE